MMGPSKYIALLLILMTGACVDRIDFKVTEAGVYPVVIEGFITDEPGPYQVKVSRAFDIESKVTTRQPLNVREIVISDNLGNTAQMIRVQDGKYQTSNGSIQGVIGRAYKLHVELLDGRVYETVPDTLKSTGTVDEIEHEIVSYINKKGVAEYGFDIFFDASAGENKDFQFLWKVEMDYKIVTSPENRRVACAGGTCPDPPDCSGYIWNYQTASLQYVKPCTCCFCWVSIDQPIPTVSDGELVERGEFTHIKAGRLPITGLTMAYKTLVTIKQYSLSTQAYNFWRSVKAQKEALTSLFQPLNGKIPTNFVQVSGDPGPLEGIFYASAVSIKSTYLSIDDIPNKRIVPEIGITYDYSCLNFDNATNVKPELWTE